MAINQKHRNRIFFISIILFMAACTFLFRVFYYNHDNRINEIVREELTVETVFKSTRGRNNDSIDVYLFTLENANWIPALKPVDKSYFDILLEVEKNLIAVTSNEKSQSYDLEPLLNDLFYIAVSEDGQFLSITSEKHGLELFAYSKYLNHGYYVVLRNEETP